MITELEALCKRLREDAQKLREEKTTLEGMIQSHDELILDDEDINTSSTIIPSIEILGPITGSRAQQLNHQVNSFLCSSANNIES
jgi:hypothetical protein